MNAGEHIGEFAALYALGTLDDTTQKSIELHIAVCARCAGLLSAAQDDVAEMAAAGPVHVPPAALLRPSLPPRRAQVSRSAWLAAAAALVIGLLPSAYFWQENRAMHVAMSSRSDVIERLAQTPVHTVAFKTMQGGAVAHVMYPPDGSWYVVLVRGASKALSVMWMHDGRKTMLGTAQPYGDLAMLYLPKSHPMKQLALVDGQRVVAEARLAY